MIAEELLKDVSFEHLVAANDHFWFSVLSNMSEVTLTPATALSIAIASSYLTLEKLGTTALVAEDEEEDPRAMLRIQIQQELTVIIANERAEAREIQRELDKKSMFGKYLAYLKAGGEGLANAA